MGGTEAADNAEASMNSEGKQNGSDNGSAAQSDIVSKVAGAASFASAALAVASSAEDDARRKMETLEKVSRPHRACVCQCGRVDCRCSCSTAQLKRKLAEAEAAAKYAAAMKVRALAARARRRFIQRCAHRPIKTLTAVATQQQLPGTLPLPLMLPQKLQKPSQPPAKSPKLRWPSRSSWLCACFLQHSRIQLLILAHRLPVQPAAEVEVHQAPPFSAINHAPPPPPIHHFPAQI